MVVPLSVAIRLDRLEVRVVVSASSEEGAGSPATVGQASAVHGNAGSWLEHPGLWVPEVARVAADLVLRGCGWRHDPPVAVKLIYHGFAKLLSWMVLRARFDTANEIEILVLRHQLAVLQRRTPRAQIMWSDRAVIAALARLLPARRRYELVVTPATILRWHRYLVRRRWTTRPVRTGRPATQRVSER
jgi:hypothetical protein